MWVDRDICGKLVERNIVLVGVVFYTSRYLTQRTFWIQDLCNFLKKMIRRYIFCLDISVLCTHIIMYIVHISYTLVRSHYSMVYIFLFILYTQSNIDWAVWIPVEFKRKSCRRSCSDIFVTAIDRIVQDFTNTKEIKIINILISQGGDGASKSEEDVICCLSGGYKIIQR